MKYLFSLALCLSFFYFGSPAQAQLEQTVRPSQMYMDTSQVANPQFEYMVRQAMLYMADSFSFGQFRRLYTETRQYDPIADDVVDKMLNLAYQAQNEKDATKRKEAVEAYRNLVMEHMANIRVVAQAISLSKLDSMFGNPAFFEWLRKGLVRDLVVYGDGKTLQTAYSVMTLTEETVLIGQLGFRVLDTQSANESDLYYNMHEVEDIRDGQKSTLFVNTSIPMRYLNAKKLEAGKNSFSMMRQ